MHFTLTWIPFIHTAKAAFVGAVFIMHTITQKFYYLLDTVCVLFYHSSLVHPSLFLKKDVEIYIIFIVISWETLTKLKKETIQIWLELQDTLDRHEWLIYCNIFVKCNLIFYFKFWPNKKSDFFKLMVYTCGVISGIENEPNEHMSIKHVQ